MCLTQVSGHPCPIKAADLTQGSWGASTVHSINIDCYVLSLSLSFLPSPTFSFFHSFPISLLAASVTSTQLWPSPGNKPHTTCACYTKETAFLFVLEKTWLKATEIKQTIIFFFTVPILPDWKANGNRELVVFSIHLFIISKRDGNGFLFSFNSNSKRKAQSLVRIKEQDPSLCFCHLNVLGN